MVTQDPTHLTMVVAVIRMDHVATRRECFHTDLTATQLVSEPLVPLVQRDSILLCEPLVSVYIFV